MNNVNKTLYIPLYGKSYVSRRGLILRDERAEEIWAAEGFPLRGKAASKWLAYNMGMRSAVFDDWVREQLRHDPDAVVLHLGCGMDSRVLRVGGCRHWYDVDFPAVIGERRRYFAETEHYRMIASDLRAAEWLEELPEGRAIVVMEGVSMYLCPEERQQLLRRLMAHFAGISLLVDCYTVFGARASKYKNPINSVGVHEVYGVDNPAELCRETGLRFVAEHSLTPQHCIDELQGLERRIFETLFAGRVAKKIYRLYEYKSG
ncbi:MAG: class I SAM-dependent methyltransferase [Oscillospiraceae bacterium]|nr:class I SAM-dependent methyltransferase [Oscillospiraceae bacterium]